jgi:hypothetical protein
VVNAEQKLRWWFVVLGLWAAMELLADALPAEQTIHLVAR